MVYFDETHITIKAFDEDANESEFIGVGKVEIKGLRVPGGGLELPIHSQQGENIGVVTGKYTIKNLNPAPLLVVKNIRTEFVKQHSFLLKTQPYVKVTCEDYTIITEHKEDGSGLQLAWSDSLRLRIKETGKILISMIDKNDENNPVF